MSNRKVLMTIGPVTIYEVPATLRGMIGGKIIAENTETNETVEHVWKRYHGGKNDKMAVMAMLISQVAPKPEEKPEEANSENKDE